MKKSLEIQQIPDSLGDIMSNRETCIHLSDAFTPLERILLTANGNVQRILSAYFNSKVSVIIHKNNITSKTNSFVEFDRHVSIECMDRVCCIATSNIIIQNTQMLDLITKDNVAIGQLFRFMNILPEFKLLQVGRTQDGFWRTYTLESTGITCSIKETFLNSAFVGNKEI